MTPFIIVTPSTPTPPSEKYSEFPLYPALPSVHSNTSSSQRSETRLRFFRRLQLLAAFLSLLVCAIAFTSVLHPAFSISLANNPDHSHEISFVDRMRVNFDMTHPGDLKARRSFGHPFEEVSLFGLFGSKTQRDEIPETTAFTTKVSQDIDSMRISSTKSVQAQLMKEARARMESRKKQRKLERGSQ